MALISLTAFLKIHEASDVKSVYLFLSLSHTALHNISLVHPTLLVYLSPVYTHNLHNVQCDDRHFNSNCIEIHRHLLQCDHGHTPTNKSVLHHYVSRGSPTHINSPPLGNKLQVYIHSYLDIC